MSRRGRTSRGDKNWEKKVPPPGSWNAYQLLPASVRAVFEVMHSEEKQPKGDEKETR